MSFARPSDRTRNHLRAPQWPGPHLNLKAPPLQLPREGQAHGLHANAHSLGSPDRGIEHSPCWPHVRDRPPEHAQAAVRSCAHLHRGIVESVVAEPRKEGRAVDR